MATEGPFTDRRQLTRLRAAEAAQAQAGVLSRRQLLALGLTRWEIEAQLRAGRWRKLGRQAIRVADGDPQLANWWRALLEVGSSAVLDGISALMASGLRTVAEDTIHVAVPKSSDPRRPRGVVVHETRRYETDCVLRDGVPRMRPATAAVHAALWATTDRQASLYVISAAQQGLFRAADYLEEVEKIRRDRRRQLLRTLYGDITGGIESVGERDFAALCAARGFPSPTRQRVWQTATGTWRFDTDWDDYSLSVEIDGVQHSGAHHQVRDALKQNEAGLAGRTVLRIPNFALRSDPEPFLDQVDAALRAGGWRSPAPVPSVRPPVAHGPRSVGRKRMWLRREAKRPTR